MTQGSSCTIQINPGSDASSTNPSTYTSCSHTPNNPPDQPVKGIAQVNATNAQSQNNIVILGYGCYYQGVYVFALDDTQGCSGGDCAGSVGGKVVATTDQVPPASGTVQLGIIWSSNGNSGIPDPNNVSYDLLPGIDESSTSSIGSPTYADFDSTFSSTYTGTNPFNPASFSSCDGISDGTCNTRNVVTFYNELITNYGTTFTPIPGPTNISFYAAGECTQTINNSSDWYLPAVCEMGYYNPSAPFTGLPACGSSATPTLQNIQSSLRDVLGFSMPSGGY